MRNYILFILCMLVLSPLDAYSQDKKQFTVSGIVVDDSGEPFPVLLFM